MDGCQGAIWAVAGLLIFIGDPQAGFWLIDLPLVPVAIWLLGFGWLAWGKSGMPPAIATSPAN